MPWTTRMVGLSLEAAGPPSRCWMWRRPMGQRTDLPPQLRGPLTGECDETVEAAGFPYGCHVCEVEVESELGTLRIMWVALSIR